MITATIQIGNSDDKLTQVIWSEYVSIVSSIVQTFANETHFFGASANYEPWQNACWVIEIGDIEYNLLLANLAAARKKYSQDSIAITVGDTIFLKQ